MTMKVNSTIKYSSIIIVTFLFACNPRYIQKGYVINSPNVNCFQTDKERNVKLSAGFHQIELQSNFALCKQFGLASTLFAGGGAPWQYGGEFAGIFFKDISDHFHYEIQSGFGYFKIRSDIDRQLNYLPGLYKRWYRQEVNTNYNKSFIQPSFFYITNWCKIGLSVKINAVYFRNYTFHYEKETEDSQGVGYNYIEYSDTQFNNKFAYIIEPVLTLKFEPVFFIQATKAYCNSIYDSDIYSNWGINQPIGTMKHPQISDFVLTFGIELTIGNKKK